MILKNKNQEEIRNIYASSKKEFISLQSNDEAIQNKDMDNYLFYIDGIKEAVGYITVYTKSDFITKEEFDVNIDVKEGSVYIWEIGTLKGFEGRGIASSLVKHVLEQYPDVDIYSVVDDINIGSVKIHEKFGFKVVASFIGHFFSDEDEKYLVYKLTRK